MSELYWGNRAEKLPLDIIIGVQPLDSFPHLSASEGGDGPVPLRLLLRLLPDRPGELPHDVDGLRKRAARFAGRPERTVSLACSL